MPAPLAKGIIITLTLVTALGAALLANPQVRAWVEEQRRKIAEALRSLGDELDPQSRRQAEAFAFEGRIPGQRPEIARRESAAARNAALKATGREGVDLDETTRRLSRAESGTKLKEEDEAERRRLGREYLARRNQEMMDAREKAKMRKSTASLEPSSANVEASFAAAKPQQVEVEKPTTSIPEMSEIPNPWSFDKLVDESGNLKIDDPAQTEMEKTLELPSPPTDEPKSFGKRKIAIAETVQQEPEVIRPVRASGFDIGSRWANPFGDEFEFEDTGYATPKAQAPAVPPKIALDPEISVPEASQPESQTQSKSKQSEREIPIEEAQSTEEELNLHGMSYDEQLARVLSLSLADEQKKRKAIYVKQATKDDADLAAAIAASLAEDNARVQQHSQSKIEKAMQKKDSKLEDARTKIAQKLAHNPPETSRLVDLTPDPPISVPQQQNNPFTPLMAPRAQPQGDLEDLYSISPEYHTKRTTQAANQEIQPKEQTQEDDDSEGLYSLSPEYQAKQSARLMSPLDISETRLEQRDSATSHSAPSSTAPVTGRTQENNTDDEAIRHAHPQAQSLSRPAPPHKDQLIHLKTSYRVQPELEQQHRHVSDRLAAYVAETSQASTETRPRTPESLPELVDMDHDVVARDLEAVRTPTVATLSPEVERDSIGFATDSEDEYASATGSFVRHAASSSVDGGVDVARPESSTSFVTEPENAHDDFSETDSVVAHSEAESASLVDADEQDANKGIEIHSADEDSDEEWGSGVRTPGSEWTDVGSQVSEEEIGGQGSGRLVTQ